MKKFILFVAVLAAVLFASSEASAQVRVRGIGNRVVVADGGGPRIGGRAFVGGIGNRVVFAAVNPFVTNSVFVQPNFVPSFGVFGASGCNAFSGGAGIGSGNIFVR